MAGLLEDTYMRKIAPLVVMLSLLVAGCSDSLTGPRLSAEQFDLVFTLSEDEIGPDGFVTAELTVTSQHPDTVVLHGNGSCGELLVYQGGDPVPFVHSATNCPVPSYMEELVLERGESHTVFWTMVSRLSEDFGELGAGDVVPPGLYTVRMRAKLIAGDEEVEVTAEAPLSVDEPIAMDGLDLNFTVAPDEVAQHEEFVVELQVTNPHHRPVSFGASRGCVWLPRVYQDEEPMRFEGTFNLGCTQNNVHFSIASDETLIRKYPVSASMLAGSGFEAGDPAPTGPFRATLLSFVYKLDGQPLEFPAVEATFTVTEAED